MNDKDACKFLGARKFKVQKQSDKMDLTEDQDVTHEKPRSKQEKASTAADNQEVYSDATSSNSGKSSDNEVTVCLYLVDIAMSCMPCSAACSV